MPNSTYARSMSHKRRQHYRTNLVTKGYLRAIVGNPEKKWFNTQLLPTSVPDTGIIQSLTDLTQGVGDSQRIGDTVTIHSNLNRLSIERGSVDAFLRVIMFRWQDQLVTTTPPNIPTVDQILENNPDLVTPPSYQSPLNKNYGKSFKVMFDKTYTIAAGQSQLQVDKIYRSNRYQVEFTDLLIGQGTVTTTNGTFLLYISNQSVEANQPLFSFIHRITYTDV